MAIIDFHSHILPGIDDGSRDLDTSCNMCDRNLSQGVEIVIATPHFYAFQDRVELFLERRSEAFRQLQPEAEKRGLPILLAAEVAYFPGIGRAELVSELTVAHTNVLLLEMPFEAWDSSILRDVQELSERFQVVIVHLERYLRIPKNKRGIHEILNLPVRVQINAESLLDRRDSRRLISMFRKGQAHFLGSDSHGMHRRPPNLMEGRQVLEKALGRPFLEHMDEEGTKLLGLSLNGGRNVSDQK